MTVDQYFGCLVFISDKIPSEHPLNNQDINWTLDLIQYLAQVARHSRKIQGKISWSCGINNPKPAHPKSNPNLSRGYCWTIHVTPSHFSSSYKSML